MVHDVAVGLTELLRPEALGLGVLGMAIGMFVGMLPGLGVSLVLSLMLPFLYHLGVVPAVAMMLGAQAGVYYSASITAILLNTPGAPESFPTTLDGFPMARRGEAGRALAISAASTAVGGVVAGIIFLGLLQAANPIVAAFHPPEYVAIIVLALVLIGATGEGASAGKVVLSAAIGLMLSFVGSDPVTGVVRFTGGITPLMSGIDVVPFALGVFALTQMVIMFGRKEAVTEERASTGSDYRAQVWWGLRDTVANWFHVLRSSVVASALGLVPGIGGFTANFISYSIGRQTSRQGKRFGTGVPAGIASAEGSSLAKEVGSLVPAVALGIPSGVGMVIFIAALTILGVQPGPALLRGEPALPYTMMWVMVLAGVVSCTVGLIITPWISHVTSVRGPVLFPFIVSLAMLGSFAAVTNTIGLVELAVFTLVGVVFRKLGYSVAAATIGLVLGSTLADNIHLTQSLYGWHFVTRSPVADVLFGIALLLLLLTAVRSRRPVSDSDRATDRQIRRQHPVLEPATNAVVMVVSAWYLAVALGYPSAAGSIPAVVAGVAAAVAAGRLALDGVTLLRRRSTDDRGLEDAPAAPRSPEGAHALSAEQHRWRLRREVLALGWVVGAAVACYLFGFEIGLPLVVVGYCLTCVEWSTRAARPAFTVVAAACALGAALAFVSLFHLTVVGRLL